MRNRSLCAILGLIVVLSCSIAAAAQTKMPDKTAKAPHSTASPDLSGVWMRYAPPATALQFWIFELNNEEPPMTAWGDAQYIAAKCSFRSPSHRLPLTNEHAMRGSL